jgi:hypothetical protein
MRTVVVGAIAVGLLTAAPSVSAGAHIGCRSGSTVFKRAGVRVFSIGRVEGNPRDEGSHYQEYFVCGHRARKPLVLDGGQPFNQESVFDFKLAGNRVGFATEDQGLQSGGSVSVGWVRLPRGPSKEAEIWATEDIPEEQEIAEHVPKVPSQEIEYAIATDGTVAVAGEGHATTEHEPLEWEVCELTVKGHGLSHPRALFKTTSHSEAPVLSSIAINGSKVSWRNKSGTPVSVPRLPS